MQGGIFSTWFMVIVCACTAAAVGAPATVVYVDAGATGTQTGSSWAEACSSLQDALALAATAEKPVEIRVAQGVYKPDQGAGITPGDQAATFKLMNGVTIKGGYPGVAASNPDVRDTKLHETILSGDLTGDDGSPLATRRNNSQRIITGSGTDTTAVLDGLTITAGFNVVSESEAALNGRGPGLMIDAGSPTVLNCRFTRNHTPGAAGAVTARNGSNPVLTGCEFLDNDATGIYCTDNSNAVLTNCRFEGNSFEAVECYKSSPVITGCRFIRNRWDAMEASDCNSILTDCVFEGGRDASGRGINGHRGHLSLTNCTFTDLRQGAIHTWGDLTLVRCTFKDNSGSFAAAVDCTPSSNVTALECTFADNSGFVTGAIWGGDMELHDCEFSGNSGLDAGAITVVGGSAVFIATGCVFSGNSGEHGAGAISAHAGVFKLSNCTFVGNRGEFNTIDYLTFGTLPVRLTQCIVWDGPEPFGSRPKGLSPVEVTYSNVQGGYPGEGNIDVDPCFVAPGYWANPDDLTKEVGPEDPNAVWLAGDYHLKSQGGHWDRTTETWVRDEVTSACIDAGDPNGLLGVEPFPNGGFVNLGAYGGSAEASKSYFGEPICESQLAGDINGDCRVDNADIDILLMHWLMRGNGIKNLPPTVTLLCPKDGDEFTYPAPILVQATASDPDGTVLRVKYTLEYRTANGGGTFGTTTTAPTNNWAKELSWSNFHYEGTYTFWAEAMDNEGAKTATPKIEVTLHPQK